MDGAQGDCPKHSEGCQHPENPSSVSPEITLHSRTNQTLACLSTPSLVAVVNTKLKQSDENWWAHKPRGPHERPPRQLALCALYNFSKQGPLKPQGDQCSAQTEGVSLNRMHTGMDLSLKCQSKTSLPSPPENGTMTPINDDG